MINLLPLKEKEELKIERNRKLVIVLGNVVVIFLVCLFLILFSLKFYILGEIVSQKTFLDDVEKKYQNKDILFLKQTVEEYNTILTKVNSFYKKEIYFSNAIEIVLGVSKPDDLYLTSISMNREGDKIKINFSGISETRDSLLVFKNNIENVSLLENIYFPPSNWIKSKDINFSFTLDYKNK